MAGGIPVTGAPGTSTSLTLGYSDDNYGDNGYWGHDDGLWQQCNDLPNAWIVIAIQHNCSGGASGCLHGRALDFATSNVDVNGFPENPSYVWTRLVGSDPNPKDVCSWSSKTERTKRTMQRYAQRCHRGQRMVLRAGHHSGCDRRAHELDAGPRHI